jgi:5'-nucleotidase
MNRKEFISKSVKASIAMGLSNSALASVGKNREGLTVLYTNDWHSRIDPFPMDGGRYQGLGGAAKRAALISKIRKERLNVLLLDSGDIFQGTPYFNHFGGELEFKLMSKMGYDAITLGNHDFDAGLNGLKKQLVHAKFDILCGNYNFDQTILKDEFDSYRIFNKGKYRVGVFGIGIELNGLVPKKSFGKTIYSDPIIKANEIAAILRLKKKCNLVICLSHLGYSYKGNKVSDLKLAAQSRNIDLILGGHTHTFLNKPIKVLNADSKVINISQTGWAGINLGKIDYEEDTFSTSFSPLFSMKKNC